MKRAQEAFALVPQDIDGQVECTVATSVPAEEALEATRIVRTILGKTAPTDTGALLAYFPRLVLRFDGQVPDRRTWRALVTTTHLVLSQGVTFLTYPLAKVTVKALPTKEEIAAAGPKGADSWQDGLSAREAQRDLEDAAHETKVSLSGTPRRTLTVSRQGIDRSSEEHRFAAALLVARELKRTARPTRRQATPATAERPTPRLLRSAHDAEVAAAEWMTHLGLGKATLTAGGPDGGVDVVADRAVGQVKMEAVPTGRPVVQQIFGIAALEKKVAVCFSLAGYTPEAIAWAARAEVPLLQFDFQGDPRPVNAHAQRLFDR